MPKLSPDPARPDPKRPLEERVAAMETAVTEMSAVAEQIQRNLDTVKARRAELEDLRSQLAKKTAQAEGLATSIHAMTSLGMYGLRHAGVSKERLARMVERTDEPVGSERPAAEAGQ